MVYTHLTREERYQISALHSAGHSLREIALTLDRYASTISRELRRNRGGRGYQPLQAHLRARERACAAAVGYGSACASGGVSPV